jgi:hypothetical protein
MPMLRRKGNEESRFSDIAPHQFVVFRPTPCWVMR